MAPDHDARLVVSERRKLVASYLTAMATSLFAAGVGVPLVASLYALPGAPSSGAALATGAGDRLTMSVGLHSAALRVLKGLRA